MKMFRLFIYVSPIQMESGYCQDVPSFIAILSFASSRVRIPFCASPLCWNPSYTPMLSTSVCPLGTTWAANSPHPISTALLRGEKIIGLSFVCFNMWWLKAFSLMNFSTSISIIQIRTALWLKKVPFVVGSSPPQDPNTNSPLIGVFGKFHVSKLIGFKGFCVWLLSLA